MDTNITELEARLLKLEKQNELWQGLFRTWFQHWQKMDGHGDQERDGAKSISTNYASCSPPNISENTARGPVPSPSPDGNPTDEEPNSKRRNVAVDPSKHDQPCQEQDQCVNSCIISNPIVSSVESAPVTSGDDWGRTELLRGWEFPECHRWRFIFSRTGDHADCQRTGVAFAVRNTASKDSQVLLVRRDSKFDELHHYIHAKYKGINKRYSLPDNPFVAGEDGMLTTTLQLTVKRHTGVKSQTVCVDALQFTISLSSLKRYRVKEIKSMEVYAYTFVREDIPSHVHLMFEKDTSGYLLRLAEFAVVHVK